MTYPIINLSQIRQILSGKVQIEDFDSSKRYLNGTIIKYNNNLYCSIIDIEPNEFNENQWKKIPFDDEINISLGNLSQNINEHISNIDNPHNVTKTQVGLSNVDNTSDADKPISKATQEALDLKADKNDTYTKLETDDLLDKKLDIDTASSTYETIINANNHKNDTNNPHNVTKTQIGLGNVDNTSDADKPISTATQEALDLKANQSTTYTKTEVDAKVSSVYRFKGSVADEKSLPIIELVIGDVYNVEDTGANYAWNGVSWDKLSETIDLTPYLLKNDASSTYETITNANNHKNNTNNPHNVTKTQVGLSNVDNTSDINKPISKATQEALDLKADKNDTYTKSEVDNFINSKQNTITGAASSITTNDLNINRVIISNSAGKISSSEITSTELDYLDGIESNIQTQINSKATKATTLDGYGIIDAYTKTESNNLLDKKLDIDTASSTYETITNVNNHISNVDNPHNVTKAQVGLSNVDNTSDLDKPISTATQEVLDLKQDNLIEGERIIINNNIISTTATRIIMREW